MEQVYNRVEAEYRKWQDRENRIEKLIPGTVEHNRPFLKEKLDFLESVQAKYSATPNDDERLLLRVLQKERDSLAVTLYPNRLVRFVRNLASSFWLQQKAKAHSTELVNNTARLSAQLIRSGFGELGAKVTYHVQQGKPEFTIPASYYPREHERLDLDLKFSRKGAGAYQFVACAAKLTNTDTKQMRSHSFVTEGQPLKFNQHEMANLLGGRAVLVQDKEVPWKNSNWIQFNLNDKDAEGNYRMREKQAEESFDPVELIKNMGIKQKHTGLDDHSMLQKLEQGDPIALNVLKQGVPQTFALELNPFQKGVNVYDAGNMKVAIDEVLQTKNRVARVVELKPQKSQEAKQTKQQRKIN